MLVSLIRLPKEGVRHLSGLRRAKCRVPSKMKREQQLRSISARVLRRVDRSFLVMRGNVGLRHVAGSQTCLSLLQYSHMAYESGGFLCVPSAAMVRYSSY